MKKAGSCRQCARQPPRTCMRERNCSSACASGPSGYDEKRWARPPPRAENVNLVRPYRPTLSNARARFRRRKVAAVKSASALFVKNLHSRNKNLGNQLFPQRLFSDHSRSARWRNRPAKGSAFGNNRPHTARGFRQIRIRSGQHEAGVFAVSSKPTCAEAKSRNSCRWFPSIRLAD